MRRLRLVVVSLVVTCLGFYSPTLVSAQYSSSNYKVEESTFGTGGDVDAASTNYRGQLGAGSLAVGTFSSANYDANVGFITQNQVFLEMTTSGAVVNLGILSDTATSSGDARAGTCNCSFTIRTYLSSQYSVITASAPPTNESGNVLTAKSVQAAPSGTSSVEEFGINLVANTAPTTMGADPVNQPDNTFADGYIASGYQTANQYKYNQGDVVAQSPATPGNPAVGQTDYTISYIAKSKPLTPAGLYVMNHALVAVATY